MGAERKTKNLPPNPTDTLLFRKLFPNEGYVLLHVPQPGEMTLRDANDLKQNRALTPLVHLLMGSTIEIPTRQNLNQISKDGGITFDPYDQTSIKNLLEMEGLNTPLALIPHISKNYPSDQIVKEILQLATRLTIRGFFPWIKDVLDLKNQSFNFEISIPPILVNKKAFVPAVILRLLKKNGDGEYEVVGGEDLKKLEINPASSLFKLIELGEYDPNFKDERGAFRLLHLVYPKPPENSNSSIINS